MAFSSNTGEPIIPSEFIKVEIQTIDGGTVLETIATPTSVGGGIFSITTSAAWNTVARTVKDVWFYKATVGGLERQAIGQTSISSVQIAPDGQLLTAAQVKAIPTNVDISGYTDDQLNFWIQVATTMIEDYTGRTF